MISIIISSYQSHFFSAVEINIAETCGVPYEIIKIENPGIMGICAAYNLGAQKAQYENLLFVHEDILFCNNLWGERLLKILQKPGCGVLGVAGGAYYSNIPATWWNSPYKYLHFIQADLKGQETFNNRIGFPDHESLIPVRALDGVLLACSKEVYNKVRFNEEITGYHGYDLIFSLEAAKNYTNYVTDQILIKHFSSGSLSKEWLASIIKVRKLIGRFEYQKTDRNIELENYRKLIYSLRKMGYTKKESLLTVLPYINPIKHGFTNTLKMIYRLKFLLS